MPSIAVGLRVRIINHCVVVVRSPKQALPLLLLNLAHLGLFFVFKEQALTRMSTMASRRHVTRTRQVKTQSLCLTVSVFEELGSTQPKCCRKIASPPGDVFRSTAIDLCFSGFLQQVNKPALLAARGMLLPLLTGVRWEGISQPVLSGVQVDRVGESHAIEYAVGYNVSRIAQQLFRAVAA